MPKTKTKTERIDESNEILIGMVKPYAGEAPPSKYLVCDGAVVSRTTYAELYALVGNRWGEGDGSTTFHLPDLRGRFLRGYDAAAGRDPDSGSRSASNAGGNTGDNVGSVQGDDLDGSSLTGSAVSAGAHTHGIKGRPGPNGVGTGLTGLGTSYGVDKYTESAGGHGHTISISGGGVENRSKNASVQYIIRVEK